MSMTHKEGKGFFATGKVFFVLCRRDAWAGRQQSEAGFPLLSLWIMGFKSWCGPALI
jgi:hypothetical protein